MAMSMNRTPIYDSPNSFFTSTSPASPTSSEFSTAVCSTIKSGRYPPPQLASPIIGRISVKDNTFSLRCRICLDSGSDEDLITPCKCSGTIALIHKSCLEEWLNVARTGNCEICGFEFKMEVSQPKFVQWLRDDSTGPERIRRRNLIGDSICLLVMIPMIVFCCWLLGRAIAEYGLDNFQWEVVVLVLLFTVLFTIFTIWFVVAIRYHYKSWLHWRDAHGRHAVDSTALEPVLLSPGRTHSLGQQPRYQSMSSEDTSSVTIAERRSSNMGHHSGLFPPPVPPNMSMSTSFFSQRFSFPNTPSTSGHVAISMEGTPDTAANRTSTSSCIVQYDSDRTASYNSLLHGGVDRASRDVFA